MLDRELKKGSAELIILSILEPRARHGYEISKLIEARSNGHLKFHVASLYPLLYRLEERGWLQGRWVEKAGERRRRFYSVNSARRTPVLARQRNTWRSFVEAMGLITGVDHADWGRDLRARLAALRLTPAREADVVEELSQHLDDRYEDLLAAGSSDADARRLAIEELNQAGGLAQRMQALSQAHPPPPIVHGLPSAGVLRGFWQDVRSARARCEASPASRPRSW